ncbi:MAG: sigma-70 family RNA polymerase sigma factor [Candidatus Uhrbacteria bacterium]|nr:sigma-70 family RNA polymerase sigma factor [Candidatus Uhrbacteria bacterium]MDP3793850.1 sigma-70 family RNA polymerase sigma factor [Candidatus Uhrbacteria bacterium]
MDHSDVELIRSYRQGKLEALDILIERHLNMIYRFLYRMVGDARAAEDLTQETFIKTWRNLTKFDSSKSFKTWIFSIAKNTAIDYLRKKKEVPFSHMENDEMPDMAELIRDVRPLPSEILTHKNLVQTLKEALSKIPAKSRSIILLHETEDMTFQDIADIMHEPMNTIKSRYRRAMLVMRNLLKNVMHQK